MYKPQKRKGICARPLEESEAGHSAAASGYSKQALQVGMEILAEHKEETLSLRRLLQRRDAEAKADAAKLRQEMIVLTKELDIQRALHQASTRRLRQNERLLKEVLSQAEHLLTHERPGTLFVAECAVCLDAPKTATLVHGGSGQSTHNANAHLDAGANAASGPCIRI